MSEYPLHVAFHKKGCKQQILNKTFWNKLIRLLSFLNNGVINVNHLVQKLLREGGETDRQILHKITVLYTEWFSVCPNRIPHKEGLLSGDCSCQSLAT
jgi:hypothetical protein